MQTPSVISIVIVTDEHYVIMLAALLKSIEENHITTENIDVYVVEDGVTAKSKQCIADTITSAQIRVHWINISEALPANVQLPVDRTSFPMIAYMRLFIPYFIPPAVSKVIFLDVDMLVMTDISRLWTIELGQYPVAAVQDPLLMTFSNHWGGVKNYKALGFTPGTPYFNSGMLVINTKQWEQEQIAQQVIDVVNRNKAYANYPDQYGLNIVLANRWLKLDNRWNYFASGLLPDPYIIHFTTRKPFYKSYNKNDAYQQLFYKYLKLTPWHSAQPVSEFRRFGKKLSNVWQKIKLSF
ncbi:glycosyltransferase family 8 protein [Mucilaginibacter koreensis]